MSKNKSPVMKVVLVDDKAKAPEKAYDSNDVGYDCFVHTIETVYDTLPKQDDVTYVKYVEYGLGVKVQIPEGYFGMLVPRSSSTDRDAVMKNSVGIIECVPKDTKIRLANGSEVLVQSLLDGDTYKNVDIMSYNETSNEFESDTLNAMWIVENNNLMEIEDSDGNIIKLPINKQIYTKSGWKKVKDLTEDDELLKFE